LENPISKTPSQKRAGGGAQGVGPEFKPQYHKNKKESTSYREKWQPERSLKSEMV
jgi:hypothetical protein